MSCPVCKENSIENDSQYGKICISCGYVLEEEIFADDLQVEGTTVVNQTRKYVNFDGQLPPKSIQSHNTISISKGKSFGLELISSISSYLRLQVFIKEEIIAFFNEMINKDNFKFDNLPMKAALVACCTYITLRRRSFPAMISSICNFVQCTSTNFTKTYNAVLQSTGITISTPTFDELVPSILRNLNFNDEITNIIPVVLNILHVASDCWITCGRIPQPYIIAAAFIAWKSLSYKRRKCSFASFCKKTHVTQHRYSALTRVKELCLALMKLAEQLPWNEKGKVNIKDIPYMLDSILNHSELLYTSAIQSEDNKEQSDDFKGYHTFRMPVKKYKRKVAYSDDSYSANSDDESISSYIRTENEIKNIKKFLKEKNKINL